MGEEKIYGNRKFNVSSTDKMFFPKEKYTKGDLIDYYEKIAPVMLPYIKDRLITMVRFPDGIKGKQFYQKGAPEYFPKWIKTKEIENRDGSTTNYVIANDQATLVYLANQASVTPHIWLSKRDKPDKPDRLIVDIDPEVDDFEKVKSTAMKFRKILEEDLGLPTFLMTTGSRGLHITIPLKRTRDFDEVRKFAQSVADLMEKENPDLVTTAARKNKRENKIFLDVGRNAFGQTGVTPYAVRPIEGAPVATPLQWEELDELPSAREYNIKTIFQRLEKKGDPWKDMDKKAVTLTDAQRKLKKLHSEKTAG